MMTAEAARALSANAARFLLGAEFDPEREWSRCEASGGEVRLYGSERYPQMLGSIDDAPAVLYVRGRLEPEDTACLAIVGSRRPTPYGLRMARELASEAATAGLIVVSGMARGIDTEAHRAALRRGGRTWAVLGSGLDRPYPSENRGLYREILDRGGAALSEVPLDGPPAQSNFPRRNRIISGLSWATVVVEGDEHSGSLITGRLAAEQGRSVFAVPGPADSPMSRGPIRLLRDGATPAACLQDILDEVTPLRSAAAPPRAEPSADTSKSPPLTPEERKILELTASEPATFDTLLRATGWGFQMLSRVIVGLEIKERIDSMPGQRYAKR